MTQVYLDNWVSRSSYLQSRIKKFLFSTKVNKNVKLSIEINLRYSLSKLSTYFFPYLRSQSKWKKSKPFFIWRFDMSLFPHQGLFKKARVCVQIFRKWAKMLKRAKHFKICPKFNKILNYFGKGHVIVRDYCTQ